MSEAGKLAAGHVRGFNERDWTRATERYAPDLVVVEPSGTSRGIDSLLSHSQGFVAGFPDCSMQITTTVEAGERAVIEGVYRGTHTGPLATPQGEVPPTGRTLELPMCLVFEASAGKINTLHVYYDQMTFAAQLGMLPEPAPTA